LNPLPFISVTSTAPFTLPFDLIARNQVGDSDIPLPIRNTCCCEDIGFGMPAPVGTKELKNFRRWGLTAYCHGRLGIEI